MVLISRESIVIKRTFDEIRNSILLSFASGQKTINQISSDTQINWKTVDNHLVHLVGKRLVREAFSSTYVRIFELTAFGKDHLRRNVKNVRIFDKKIIRINGNQ